MHYKRKRPKSTRAGCLLCKPWKRQECAKHKRMRHGIKIQYTIANEKIKFECK